MASPEHKDSWNVQLFRSIDSDSVVGFPETNREAFELDLVTGKGTTVERSIHKAYIYAIRRAQHFLYIENQYFLGSAQAWPTGAHPAGGCDHLVCVEIALKCVEKIKAGASFCAYILIPPFPEGVFVYRVFLYGVFMWAPVSQNQPGLLSHTALIDQHAFGLCSTTHHGPQRRQPL